MSDNKKPALANLQDYWQKMREEGEEDERRNKGCIWTIQISGTSTISTLFATVNYTLNLNCSHVGKDMYGVYRGEMDFRFDGDMAGTKLVLAALGIGSDEDLSGWFRNDRFIMRLKPFDPQDEKEFIQTFDESKREEDVQEEQDELKQAASDMINGILNSMLSKMSVKEDAGSDEVKGLWYDWDTHMTDGDLGVFLKLNGGMLYWYVNGIAQTDASGGDLHVDETAYTIFSGKISERYDEMIPSPFPYTLRIYDNNKAVFTLYNSKGGPVTVDWMGTIDCIPVEDTVTVK